MTSLLKPPKLMMNREIVFGTVIVCTSLPPVNAVFAPDNFSPPVPCFSSLPSGPPPLMLASISRSYRLGPFNVALAADAHEHRPPAVIQIEIALDVGGPADG